MSEIFEVSDKWVVSEEWVRDSIVDQLLSCKWPANQRTIVGV
jgi:hypothetical protein